MRALRVGAVNQTNCDDAYAYHVIAESICLARGYYDAVVTS
jgi:hypothetical protein